MRVDATLVGGRTPSHRAREFPFVSFPAFKSSLNLRVRPGGTPRWSWWVCAHPSIRGNLAASIHPSIHPAMMCDAFAVVYHPTRRRPTRCVGINVPCVLKSTLSLHPLHPLHPLSLSVCVSLSSRARSRGSSTLDGCTASLSLSLDDVGIRLPKPTTGKHTRTNECNLI